MSISDTRLPRYDDVAIALHWAVALLLPAQLGLGWYMLSIEEQPGSNWFFELHISIGLTIAMLVAGRIFRRAHHAAPALPCVLPAWRARAAGISHALLYAAMVLLPLTGYVGSAFGDGAISYFGLALPSWAPKDDFLKDLLFNAHAIVAWVLVALVVLHIAAAAEHALVSKSGIFERMWPGPAREP